MKVALLKFKAIRFLYWRIYSLPKYIKVAIRISNNCLVVITNLLVNYSFFFFRMTANFSKRVNRWIYWRRVSCSNWIKAIFRRLRNFSLALFRYISNYSTLYSNILLRNLGTIFKYSKINKKNWDHSKRITNENGTLAEVTPERNLEFSSNYFSFSTLVSLLKFRFSPGSNITDEEIRKTWIDISVNLDGSDPTKSLVDLDANLILHVHYLDIAVEIIEFLMSQKIRFREVIVTTTDENSVNFLREAVDSIRYEMSRVVFVNNSFRDARPFLIAARLLENKSPVLKLHTKKSPHLLGREGEIWRRELVEGLVPSAESAERFTRWLHEESAPTVICPVRWLSDKGEWGRNDLHIFSLCRELGIVMRRRAPFPKGTMFWINGEFLQILKLLRVPDAQEESERNWTDSTWAHGLERLVGQIVLDGGRGYRLIIKDKNNPPDPKSEDMSGYSMRKV